jgi:hypothetical protein
MSYKAVKTRVEVAEEALARQLDHTQASWYRLKHVAGEAFTPGRILGTGALTGFLVGFVAPWARMGGTMRIVELATSVANLVGALQAQAAAEEASDVADSASEVVVETAEAMEESQIATAETKAVRQEVEAVAEEAEVALAEAESASEVAEAASQKARAASRRSGA